MMKFNAETDVFIPAAWPCADGYRIQKDSFKALERAGVKALRQNAAEFKLSLYPTNDLEATVNREIHRGLRVGEFFALAKTSPDKVLFGITIEKSICTWLRLLRPGELDHQINTWLYHMWSNVSEKQRETMEAQLRYENLIEIMKIESGKEKKARLSRLLPIHNPDFTNYYEIPVGVVYLKSDDWERIVTKGKKDGMGRADSDSRFWDEWRSALLGLFPDWR